jgi:hypothetical protein
VERGVRWGGSGIFTIRRAAVIQPRCLRLFALFVAVVFFSYVVVCCTVYLVGRGKGGGETHRGRLRWDGIEEGGEDRWRLSVPTYTIVSR